MSHSGSCALYSSEIRLNGQINQKLHWLNQKINFRDYTTMTVNKCLPMNGRLYGERLTDASPIYGLPASTLQPLTTVLHCAAKLIKNLSPRDHVTTTLCELQWLPIPARINFKIKS